MSHPLEALRHRHAKDVLIEECKMGSSWNGARRLDAWVLLKTWSPWTTIGYEIKVSRQDFLGDRKWVEYLPACHEMYFVCPRGLIQPEELPAECGLLWTTGGIRLTTRRKAVRREPEPAALCRLMSYALMSRARIVGDMWQADAPVSNAARWRQWLTEKDDSRRLGQEVSKRLRARLAAAESVMRAAQLERDRLSGIREHLVQLGLGDCRDTWELQRRLGASNSAPALAEIQRLAQRIAELSKPRATSDAEATG